jgi:hypothetical protein
MTTPKPPATTPFRLPFAEVPSILARAFRVPEESKRMNHGFHGRTRIRRMHFFLLPSVKSVVRILRRLGPGTLQIPQRHVNRLRWLCIMQPDMLDYRRPQTPPPHRPVMRSLPWAVWWFAEFLLIAATFIPCQHEAEWHPA